MAGMSMAGPLLDGPRQHRKYATTSPMTTASTPIIRPMIIPMLPPGGGGGGGDCGSGDGGGECGGGGGYGGAMMAGGVTTATEPAGMPRSATSAVDMVLIVETADEAAGELAEPVLITVTEATTAGGATVVATALGLMVTPVAALRALATPAELTVGAGGSDVAELDTT